MCTSLIENSAEEVIALEHNHRSFSSSCVLLMPNYINIQFAYRDMGIILPSFTIWSEVKKLMKAVSFLKISYRRVIALDF